MATNIIQQIEAAGLVGRGGASFPVAKKWLAVKSALEKNKTGYIIVNGAEGEPGVKKDGYLFAHYSETVFDGVCLANRFLGAKKIKKIYIFLNHDYSHKYQASLRRLLKEKKFQTISQKVEFFIKPEELTYISGEETALLNLIEGRKVQPRLKPPYPTESGLYGCPTLISNPETFYDVSLAVQGRYEGKRFVTVDGFVNRPGVYQLPVSMTIAEILEKTNNYPTQPFFVQIGGNASGEVLNSNQLSQPVNGAGSVMVYDLNKTDERKLIEYWINFYKDQSCGQCSVCREGTYRLSELMKRKKIDYITLFKLVSALEETSYCALGSSLAVPLRSYLNNISKK